MIEVRFVRGLTAASMLATAVSSLPASAQAVPYSQNVVVVPCCRCADGSTQTRSLNTGAAPWRVTPPGGAAAGAVQVPTGQIPSSWTSLPPAKWVYHPTVHGVGGYLYELRVYVQPNCIIPARATFGGAYAADNSGSLRVNTNPPVNTNSSTGFLSPTPIPLTGLVPGMNVIRVRVINLHGPTGFLLRGQVNVRCPNQPPPVIHAAADAEADAAQS